METTLPVPVIVSLAATAVSPAGIISVSETLVRSNSPVFSMTIRYRSVSPAVTSPLLSSSSSHSTNFQAYREASFAVSPTGISVGWSPLPSLPSSSVGSGTVWSESTDPWLEIMVPSGVPPSTVTSNVMVTVAPEAMSPMSTDRSGSPLSSTVPTELVREAPTYVVLAGMVSVKTTPVTSEPVLVNVMV